MDQGHPSATLVGCVDRRVPQYKRIAKALDVTVLSQPGLGDDKADGKFIDSYIGWWESKGVVQPPPLLFMPHEQCRAWSNSDDNYANACHAAEYAWSRGVPAMAVKLRDGQRPEVLFDGLKDLGQAVLFDAVSELINAPGVDWQFNHLAVTDAVVVGHMFRHMPHERTLRFSSWGITHDTVRTIRIVVCEHKRDKSAPLPLYFSPEVGKKRQQTVADLLLQHNVPVQPIWPS